MKKRQRYYDKKYVTNPCVYIFHHPPPILIIVVIKIIKSREVKNMIAHIDIIQLPISFSPEEILDSVTGSERAAVILYTTAIKSILSIGTNKRSIIRIIPKIPTTLLIDDIHLRNSSTVSDVNPPTIGIKLLRENFAVLSKSPSDVLVKSP